MLKGDDPPYPSGWTGGPDGPGGHRDQGHGIVLYDQGEEYQKPINGSIKVQEGEVSRET